MVARAAIIPSAVGFEAAAFTPLAAIGLQGLRLAAPTLGERVVVYGLGLIGLLTVQLLRANGCAVIGIDRDAARLALAEQLGATAIDGSGDNVSDQVLARTRGIGADAVLLTLASPSDAPLHHAAVMSRKRGRLVLVGVTGLSLRRDDFYEKELSLAVSCSYGPGRYDAAYEDKSIDYPLPFVRWTEQRNFEAVLALMAQGTLDPLPLVTHRYDFAQAAAAYDLIAGSQDSLGVLLSYPDRGGEPPSRESRVLTLVPSAYAHGRRSAPPRATLGLIGAGNFAVRTLIPALRATGARLHTIASSGGANGAIAAKKFGFERATTDVAALLENDEIDTVFILTRHDSHASLAMRALEAGKHVFVEKPLALEEADLDLLRDAAEGSGRMLTVGFNRRFAPLAVDARQIVKERAGPLAMIATVNAGHIPRDHWTQDREAGGGRIVGEACHFIDLCRFLVGAPIVDVQALPARDAVGNAIDDIIHLSIAFADGSTASVNYLSSGARSYPKERIECFWDGKTIAIENWRRLRRFGVAGPLWERSRTIDKGHVAESRAWINAVRRNADSPIPLDELMEVSRWSIVAGQRARL